MDKITKSKVQIETRLKTIEALLRLIEDHLNHCQNDSYIDDKNYRRLRDNKIEIINITRKIEETRSWILFDDKVQS